MGMFIFLVLLILFWQGAYYLSVELFQWFKSYAVPSPAGVGERFVEHPITTSGLSGFSSSCTKTVWPIKPLCLSTGAPPASAF